MNRVAFEAAPPRWAPEHAGHGVASSSPPRGNPEGGCFHF